jgi:hypothetical protein
MESGTETRPLSGPIRCDCAICLGPTDECGPYRSRDLGPDLTRPTDVCLPCWSEKVEPDLEENARHRRLLQDSSVKKQAINIWGGPKYTNYTALVERVKSFENSGWPEIHPSPISMAEAGFFYDRELTTFF